MVSLISSLTLSMREGEVSSVRVQDEMIAKH